MNVEHKQKLARLKALTIAHPMYSTALNTLHRAAEAKSVGGEDCGAIIFGDSGVGKTHLSNDFMNEFLRDYIQTTPLGTSLIRPVIYCRVPSEATVKAVINRTLETIEIYLSRQSQETLEFQLFKALKTCDTKLLVLDEFPHMLRSLTSNALREVADWIKNLSDLFAGLVLLAGESDCEALIDQRAAFADRFPYRAYLKPFSLSTEEGFNDFERLLRAFAIEIKSTMGFIDMPCLTSEKEVLAFYALTQGNLRLLAKVLSGACEAALRREDYALLLTDFSTASNEINFRTRLAKPDLFSLSLKELRKLVYGVRR